MFRLASLFAAAALLLPPAPDIQPQMQRLDTNRDGAVTVAEMRAGGIAPTGR